MKTGHGVCFLPITLKKELVSASLMQALACSRCLSKLSQPGKKIDGGVSGWRRLRIRIYFSLRINHLTVLAKTIKFVRHSFKI